MELFNRASREYRDAVCALFGYKLDVKTTGLYKLRPTIGDNLEDFLLFKVPSRRFAQSNFGTHYVFLHP
ncbi:unnamed protein product [Protopolystoma xenopodis]|uniref:Uncharacterized protein n=1 Tax=Protopolystoma xenopodis TaxID=117903 RepID=A0A448X8I0_9PLAT|nr:unnamed protein product [Protopolystoma xenopodis]